ncbi:glycerol-3-phosphate acyltransferase 5 [Lactuca sativa]|uniref:Phospholipid/glycerol acyltransferase domain-containing protein n=1 Tax=Lactuca sativa TaxID=4236 RepID=A0A9R1XEW8_LACSA|nr:glycerol-3-phosphate acyltransferase 5 [Lactuca sativa]KAJ0210291.1 hypothetical protein LSAT_V11C400224850 [Lactuca sativa]
MESVVSSLEGTLLKNNDPFSYFMLVAYEASGLIRFTFLLLLWPVIRLLDVCGKGDVGVKLAIFIATAGVPISEIESVARAVLPKFYLDDLDLDAWRVFNSGERRVVVTKMPRVMVEHFVREHLRADDVVGSELRVTGFRLATGLVQVGDFGASIADRIAAMFEDKQPSLGLGRCHYDSSFLSLCKEQISAPYLNQNQKHITDQEILPEPVIFHDGRLVQRPTPSVALSILLWIPFGIIIAIVRLITGNVVPPWLARNVTSIFVWRLVVRGIPPSPPSQGSSTGVLFVCTHRSLMDPVVLSTVLQRKIPAVTYSLSRLSEFLSPIPTVRLTRNRQVDAERIKKELSEGDLVICPEGTTCREPILLRFSALFAELTDRIVPVAMNCRVGFFHATTARGWKGLDPIFFFMNPNPIYEVTFMNQLPVEATCSSGKSPQDVANYVQRILAASLGFECTNFTRKDKYRILAGSDGTVGTGT